MELPTHVPLTPQWYATSSSGTSKAWEASSVSHLPVLLTVCGVAAGSVGDHATLLCSLLLGFYLDAYVAVGTSIDAAGQESFYVWVMTRGRGRVADAHQVFPLSSSLSHVRCSPLYPGRGNAAQFWEPETGHRYAPGDTTRLGHRFCRVRVC